MREYLEFLSELPCTYLGLTYYNLLVMASRQSCSSHIKSDLFYSRFVYQWSKLKISYIIISHEP
jgi:hypothetical protein